MSVQLDNLMLRDQLSIKRRLKQNNNKLSEQLAAEIAEKQQIVVGRQQSCPEITYPESLPVVQKKQEIYQAIRDNQVVIIAGETGSGKTTQIPKICLELGRGIKGMIGHTQPRRLAARSVANRIAQELSVPLGSAIGYKVRFHDQVSDNTLVKLMTDGILLAEIQQDKLLYQYDTIIIDEAHERSLNIDFILGYLKRILPKRPDLKVIITSATIDPDRFSNHFDQAPIIEVSGRTYPVEIRYRPMLEEDDEISGIFSAVDELLHEKMGDILIFLTGEREIRDTAEALNKRDLPHTEILPLYARLSSAEQNRIFQSHSGRRIILATNVAETSLTVPGIKYVIDSGVARISRYSYRTKVQRLPIEPISQASANQRSGRCGRTSEGICIRLYSEEDYLTRPQFTEPEILRTNLASVILQMTSLGLGDIAAFPFVEAPDKRNIQDGIRLLEELGALDEGKLSAIGKQLAQFPLDPRLARMIIEGQKNGCVREILIITAALSIQEMRERPLEKQQAADEKHRRFTDKDSDFLALVNLWNYLREQQKLLSGNQFRKMCKSDFLNYLRIREWQDLYTQLRQSVKQSGLTINTLPADYQQLHVALLSGLLSHIGQKENEKHEFLGGRNSHFFLFPNSSLFKKPPKWCMVAELVETSRLWGRVAARIDPEWIEPLALHLVKRSYSEPHWAKSQASVMAKEKVTLFGLVIVSDRSINYSRIDPVLCRQLFIRHALVEGEWQTKHRFYHENLKLLQEVEELEHKSRRRDIVVDDETLYQFYEKRIPTEIISGRHFDNWWKKTVNTQPDLLSFEKSMLISANTDSISKLDYPDYWRQNNFKLRLTYQFEPGNNADGVTVHIPLAILNQITEQGFDWQINGLRKELIVALIKSLPKPIRRNFVPAPNYAEAFLARVEPMQTPLLDALEREFRRMSGVTLSRNDWQLELIASYLKMTFRIIDDKNKLLAEGKDLNLIKRQLQQQMQQTLSAVVDSGIEKQNLSNWDFADLPQCYEQKQGSYSVKAYPALVDNRQSVAIKLFETEPEQQQAMAKGLRRLLLLNIPSPIKYLHEKLPNKAKLGLYFNPFGTVLELIDDCIDSAVDELIVRHGGYVWQGEQFQQLQQYVRMELNPLVVEIASQVEKLLTTAFNINKRLKGRVDIATALALADIKEQLNHLIYRGFVATSGYSRLNDIYRYLQAIEKRLDKIATDPQRDRVYMLKVEYVQQLYQQLQNKYKSQTVVIKALEDIRWMIEELRVSFFAQQLGTAYPISEKRIIQAIEAIKI